MSTDNPALDRALLDAFRDLPLEDQRELARFVDLLNRRAAHPDEPPTHSYAEVYGEVVLGGETADADREWIDNGCPTTPGQSKVATLLTGSERGYEGRRTMTTGGLTGEDERIVRAAVTGLCDCGGEMGLVSVHERDSSNDRHACPRCGWGYGEMATWRLGDAIREARKAADEVPGASIAKDEAGYRGDAPGEGPKGG